MSSSLTRSVRLPGAIFLGLGSILGTGVFVSLGLAAGIAGLWAVAALGIAAFLAAMNALSSAQLAANHPVSGGTYAYGYRYISPYAGFTAGLCFMLAKSASAAAAAIGLVGYLATWLGYDSALTNVYAAISVLIVTGLVASGLRRANVVNMGLVGLTLALLIVLIVLSIMRPGSSATPLVLPPPYAPNLLEAAALLFVAFTGYGRIATLGEEVQTPRKTIPRAIILTLCIVTLLYFGVMLAAIVGLGVDGFARVTLQTAAPLEALAHAINIKGLVTFTAIAAASALAGVLLNLILGLSRVAFAMGRQGDLPAVFRALSKRQEPLIAVWGVGIFIAAIAMFGGLKMVWSFSAFTVLIYYAITNWASLQLTSEERLYPRWVSWLGLAGCLGLAFWVDGRVIILGCAAIVAAHGIRFIKRPQ